MNSVVKELKIFLIMLGFIVRTKYKLMKEPLFSESQRIKILHRFVGRK